MELIHVILLALAYCLGRWPVNTRWCYVLLGAALSTLLWRFSCAADFIFYAVGMILVCAFDFSDQPAERPHRAFAWSALGFISMSVWTWLTLWLSGQHLAFLAGLRDESIASGFTQSILLRWIFGGLLLIVVLVHWRQLQRSLSGKYVVSIGYLSVAIFSLIINPAILVPSTWTFWGVALFGTGWAIYRFEYHNQTIPCFAEPDRSTVQNLPDNRLFVYGMLTLILLVATGLRWATAVPDQLLWPDSTQYLHFANEIRELRFLEPGYDLDEGFVTSRRLPPVYSTLIALLSFISTSMIPVGVGISFVMSVAAVLLVFYMGRHFHSSTAGLLAAGFLAINPFALRYATSILTESTFAFLYTATCFAALLAIERRSTRLLMLTGVLAALAFLTREVGLICFALTVWGLLLHILLVQRMAIRPVMLQVSVLLFCFLLTCLPYFVYVRAFTGHWGITARMPVESIGRKVLAFGGDPSLRDSLQEDEEYETRLAQRDEQLQKNASIKTLASKVWTNGRDYFQSFIEQQGRFLHWALLLSLIPIGFLHAIDWRTGLWRWACLFSWGLALIFGYALLSPYLVDTRYLYPLLTLLSILAATLVVECCRMISKAMSQPILAILLPAMVLFLVYDQLQPQVQAERWQVSSTMLQLTESAGHAEMAEELLREHPEYAGKRVITRKGFPAYFLNARQPMKFPRSRELGELDADLLVADSLVLSEYRPQFRYLFSECYQPQPGKIVYSRLFPEKSRVITVYDLNATADNSLPTDTSIEDNLKKGHAFLRQNDLWQASRHCRAILQMAPDNAAARELYALIDRACLQATDMPWFCDK